MYGPYDILPAAMCKESMTWLPLSFRFFFQHTSVSLSIRLRLIDTNDVADSDPEEFDPSLLPTQVFHAIEADSFWCLSRLLDGIQDNYICAQPGIQRSVRRMAELVARIDGTR
jgi:hypothetical protein